MNVSRGLRTRESAKVKRHNHGSFVGTEQQRSRSGCRRVVRWCFLCAVQSRNKQQTRFRLDFIDCTVGQRNDEDITVRRGLYVSGNAKIAPNHKTLAFGLVKLVEVVRDSV